MIPDEDISEQVASRDLKLLVDNDLLVPFGSKRGRFYMASNKTKRFARQGGRGKGAYRGSLCQAPRGSGQHWDGVTPVIQSGWAAGFEGAGPPWSPTDLENDQTARSKLFV